MNNLAEPADRGETHRFFPQRPTDDFTATELAAQIMEFDASEQGYRGYLARVFSQVCLPYKDPIKSNPDAVLWQRRNGNVSLTIEPRLSIAKDGTVTRNFAYGKYPRLILPWLSTQIIHAERAGKTTPGQPVDLSLGSSLREFFYELGVPWGGKQGKKMREQLENLLRSRFTVELRTGDDTKGHVAFESFNLASKYELWWGSEEQITGQGSLLDGSIRLSAEFVEGVLESPVPIDLRSLSLLMKQGAMAMDIYMWMAYRLPAAKRSTLIKWETLSKQFGAQYSRTRDFKMYFIRHLKSVSLAYPDARFTVTDEGLVIYPSPPSVARSQRYIPGA